MSIPCHEGPPATAGHLCSEPAVAGGGRYYCTNSNEKWYEREDQGEGVQNGGKTGTDVRAETWVLKKAQENKLEVAEMRMLMDVRSYEAGQDQK